MLQQRFLMRTINVKLFCYKTARMSADRCTVQAAEKNNVLFVSVSDHFELCLAKCRTSSTSVQHENTYRDNNSTYEQLL